MASCSGRAQNIDSDSTDTNHVSNTDILNVLHKSRNAIYGTPSYTDYVPGVFILDNQDNLGISLMTDDVNPKDVNACRLKYAQAFKEEEKLTNAKLVEIIFKETLYNSKLGINENFVTVYVEHKLDSKGFVYYYPYKKVKGGKIEIDSNSIKRNSIDKIFFID